MSSGLRQVFLGLVLVLCSSAFGASSLGAQLCRGGRPEALGWMALTAGVAAADASVIGGEVVWRFEQGLQLFGDADITAYPRPDPTRGRVAVGAGIELFVGERFGVCTTVAFERERMGDLRAQRIPIGLAMGWSVPLAGVERHIGFTLEPFYVHGHARVARWSHGSDFVSGRAGMIYVARRLLLGFEYENAFDDDARWQTIARVGVTFN